MIEIRAPSGGFGVTEIRGIGPDADPAHAPALRPALARHAVLCLRMPRPLADAELRAIASLFGPIKDPVGRTKDGGASRYAEKRQSIDAGFVLTDETRTRSRRAAPRAARPTRWSTSSTRSPARGRSSSTSTARSTSRGCRSRKDAPSCASQARAEAAAPRCEHAWRDHDVLVWDNASVQHKAAGNFALGEPRRFWRYLIAGAAPA